MSAKYSIPRETVVKLLSDIDHYVSLWKTLRADLAYRLIKSDVDHGIISVDRWRPSLFGLVWRKERHTRDTFLEAWYQTPSGNYRGGGTCVTRKLSVICSGSDNHQWRIMAHFISGYDREYLHNNVRSLKSLMEAWVNVSNEETLALDLSQLKTASLLINDLPTVIKAASEYISDKEYLYTYDDLTNDLCLLNEDTE